MSRRRRFSLAGLRARLADKAELAAALAERIPTPKGRGALAQWVELAAHRADQTLAGVEEALARAGVGWDESCPLCDLNGIDPECRMCSGTGRIVSVE